MLAECAHLAMAWARIPILVSDGGRDEWPGGAVTLIFTSI